MNHDERYIKLISLTGKEKDNGYQAACYLLASSQDLYDIASKLVCREGIPFDEIKKEYSAIWNDKDKSILLISENLFRYQTESSVSPFEMSRLGYPYLDIVCKAIFVASGYVDIEVNEVAKSLNFNGVRYQCEGRTKSQFLSLIQKQEEEESVFER